MNNLLKLGVFLGAIAGILALSNPTQETHAENLVWQIKDNYCQQTQLSDVAQAGCYTIAPLPPGAIEPVIISYTRRHNYFLFSIYTTDIWGMKNRVVGLGGQFFQF